MINSSALGDDRKRFDVLEERKRGLSGIRTVLEKKGLVRWGGAKVWTEVKLAVEQF